MSRVLKGSLIAAALATACVAVPYSWEVSGGRSVVPPLRSNFVSGVNAPLVPEDSTAKASWSGYMDGRPVPAGFETPRQTRWVVPSQPG